MTYTDLELVCCDCDRPFTFNRRDQKFYFDHDLTTPKRCKGCRAAKRRRVAEHELQRMSRA